MSVQTLTLLGATGSIGQSTLAVLRAQPERFRLFGVTAHRNVAVMATICREFRPEYVVMTGSGAARDLQLQLQDQPHQPVILDQPADLVALAEDSRVTTVMAAIVGAAGLLPTLAAVRAGKKVLLANKEALVMSGQLFMDAVREAGAQLLPVDSEHNAIFQALPAAWQDSGTGVLADYGVNKILLTGSGGPFRTLPVHELRHQTPASACRHPNWSMGQKISVDSATMLNKGLEYIEARWLFGCQKSELEVILHPQSVVHSMVQYTDGSVLAQLGQPDMRTPIAHTLGFPERLESGVKPLDFGQLGALEFALPDLERYPCLRLAQEACWTGQAATTTLNAANEVAVAAFLQGQLRFDQIAVVCEQVMEQLDLTEVSTLEAVLACDAAARQQAHNKLEALR